MLNIDIDSVVKAAAEKLTEADLQNAKTQTKIEFESCDWNRNRPLNMIAYEDQQ
jgi:hypothetical protein